MVAKLMRKMGGGIALSLYSILVHAYEFNLQPPETPIASEIFHLHNLILWVCVGIFIVVFSTMFYSIYKHRKSVGHKAAHFHENTTVEIIWTIIPFFILMGMAYPATQTVLAMRDASDPDMTVKVTGYQWKWEYEYPKEGIKFFSILATPRDQIENKAAKGEHYLLEVDNPLVVPAGKKIRVLLTGNDVIHSWSVPAFGVKQDAIPGFIKDDWFKVDKPGIYRGQCSELCGKDHGFMPIVVEAKEPAEYAKWVEAQKVKMAAAEQNVNKVYTMEEMKPMGEKVYTANCAACHQANGKGIPNVFKPLDGSPTVQGPKLAHMETVMNGRPGTAMQAFAKQLSDTDIAAVITYERNSWSNKTGEVIQPSEIKALRK